MRRSISSSPGGTKEAWWLLCYGLGLAAALTAVVMWWAPDWWSFFNRSGPLTDAVRAHEHGRPLLIGETPAGEPYSVGIGDDLGLFVLGPLLARLTGITDPFELSRLLMLIFYVPVIVLSPLLFRRITGSTVVAVLMPVGLLLGVRLFGESPYWIVAWAVLGLIPILLWVDDRWTPGGCAALSLVVMLAGVAATLRSVAGISVLIAVVGVLSTRPPWPRWVRAVVAAGAIGLYLLVSSVTISALESHRDREAPASALRPDALDSHVFWHSAYIGMGYLPNDHELWWNDSVALRDARRVEPQVDYLTNRYERVMRELTLDLVEEDPWLAVRVVAAKLLVAIAEGVPYLLALLVLLPAAIRVRAPFFRRLLLVTAPAALLGLLSGVVGLPTGGYVYGWLASLWLLCVASISFVVAGWLERASPDRGAVSAALRGVTPPRLLLAGALAAALLVIALSGAGLHDRAVNWSDQNGGVDVIVSPP